MPDTYSPVTQYRGNLRIVDDVGRILPLLTRVFKFHNPTVLRRKHYSFQLSKFVLIPSIFVIFIPNMSNIPKNVVFLLFLFPSLINIHVKRQANDPSSPICLRWLPVTF